MHCCSNARHFKVALIDLTRKPERVGAGHKIYLVRVMTHASWSLRRRHQKSLVFKLPTAGGACSGTAPPLRCGPPGCVSQTVAVIQATAIKHPAAAGQRSSVEHPMKRTRRRARGPARARRRHLQMGEDGGEDIEGAGGGLRASPVPRRPRRGAGSSAPGENPVSIASVSIALYLFVVLRGAGSPAPDRLVGRDPP